MAEYSAIVSARTHVLVFFWADWHEPSKPGGQMDSVFRALSARYPDISFIKLEAENIETAEVAEALQVSVVPTFVGVLAGQFWGNVEGANPAGTALQYFYLMKSRLHLVSFARFMSELSGLLKRFSAAAPGSGVDPKALQDRKDALNDRLRSLVSSAPVMLFMKGCISLEFF